MLELLLLRHAKSRWDEPGVDDHDRDLAPRGLKAAQRMGELLAAEDLLPDLVLCSTARRAMHTWQLVATAAGAAPPVRFDSRLYLAAPATMIAVARESGGTAGRLMLVGHDPGMHDRVYAEVGIRLRLILDRDGMALFEVMNRSGTTGTTGTTGDR